MNHQYFYPALLSFLLLSSTSSALEPGPRITPGGGVFTEPMEVSISSDIPGAEIRYTTNFYVWPSADSTLYEEPLTIGKKVTIRAAAYKDGVAVSEVSVAYLNFFKPEIQNAEYDWQPQPEKAALMMVFAHPDDEVGSLHGVLPYYAGVRKLPTVGICMANSDKVKYDRLRRKELECSFWTCGMRNPPLYGNFPDSCYGQTVACCLDLWGLDNATRYLTEQIRKYKPEVIVTHDFSGEYGAPNHMVTAMATLDAYLSAGDKNKYPEQLDSLEVWQPKKLYVHYCPFNSWEHDWDTPYPELGGKTPLEVAAQSIEQCHFSQQGDLSPVWGRIFGLLKTEVGPDVEKKDFFENIDMSFLEK